MSTRRLILLLSLLGAAWLCALLPASFTSLQVGDQAPAFSLPHTSGKTVSLSNLEGRPFVLNFWTST
jgi:hypothetical protein